MLRRFLRAWRRNPDEYYYGTPQKERADIIIQRGTIRAREKAYIDDDLLVPVSFAMCASSSWATEPEDYRLLRGYVEKYGQYGYVFVIKQEDLPTDIVKEQYHMDGDIFVTSSEIPVRECWRLDRMNSYELDHDVSNFFDIAVPYWKNSELLTASKSK